MEALKNPIRNSNALHRIEKEGGELLDTAVVQATRYGRKAVAWGKKNPQTLTIAAIATVLVAGLVVVSMRNTKPQIRGI